ncbi:hypothetical protein [Prauserella endophytica]|uniref:hypothetical protein n=1 Tax=Prauserella endophytica TaxID=1592324 RepID=UPI0013051C60|nr:hypothetical protein [Prauserella endophytica]
MDHDGTTDDVGWAEVLAGHQRQIEDLMRTLTAQQRQLDSLRDEVRQLQQGTEHGQR